MLLNNDFLPPWKVLQTCSSLIVTHLWLFNHLGRDQNIMRCALLLGSSYAYSLQIHATRLWTLLSFCPDSYWAYDVNLHLGVAADLWGHCSVIAQLSASENDKGGCKTQGRGKTIQNPSHPHESLFWLHNTSLARRGMVGPVAKERTGHIPEM